MHGFRCYDNIAPNAKCQRVLVLALCLVVKVHKLVVVRLACTQNAVRSVDLSRVSVAADTIQHNVRHCLARGKDAVSRSLTSSFSLSWKSGLRFPPPSIVKSSSISPVFYRRQNVLLRHPFSRISRSPRCFFLTNLDTVWKTGVPKAV